MTLTEVKAWQEKKGCMNSEQHSINGIDYLLTDLPDGWTAIFEIEQGEYTPIIEAAGRARALAYCNMREPITVPAEIL